MKSIQECLKNSVICESSKPVKVGKELYGALAGITIKSAESNGTPGDLTARININKFNIDKLLNLFDVRDKVTDFSTINKSYKGFMIGISKPYNYDPVITLYCTGLTDIDGDPIPGKITMSPKSITLEYVPNATQYKMQDMLNDLEFSGEAIYFVDINMMEFTNYLNELKEKLAYFILKNEPTDRYLNRWQDQYVGMDLDD